MESSQQVPVTVLTGFLPDNPIFEIHGQCEQCSLNITNN